MSPIDRTLIVSVIGIRSLIFSATGPPGAMCIMRNEMRLIPTRIGTAPTSRRTMYRSIAIASRPDPVLLEPRRDVPLDEVVRDAGRGRPDPPETVLDHRQRLGDEKEDGRA